MATGVQQRLLRLPSLHRIDILPRPVTSPTRHHVNRSYQFSTSASPCKDNNRMRGLSAVRRSGLRGKGSRDLQAKDLPVPVFDPAKRGKIESDPKHGLWGFFNREKTLLSFTADDAGHGRAWTVQELRIKSWEDLHALWWKCVKERNRIATERVTRETLSAGYGQYEADEREDVVKETQRSIKYALTERWYTWEDARKAALGDPEIEISGDTTTYRPLETDFEDEEFEEEEEEEGEEEEETEEDETKKSRNQEEPERRLEKENQQEGEVVALEGTATKVLGMGQENVQEKVKEMAEGTTGPAHQEQKSKSDTAFLVRELQGIKGSNIDVAVRDADGVQGPEEKRAT